MGLGRSRRHPSRPALGEKWEVSQESAVEHEGRDDRGWGRGGEGEGEDYHPTRPLLAGGIVFWLDWGWGKGGIGRGDRCPGPWIGTRGGGESSGGELVAKGKERESS